MTLCTMLIEKEEEIIKHIFLTADTRISDDNNFTDNGHKIFNFTKNVIVAVAGDYAWFMLHVKVQMEENIKTNTISGKSVKEILHIISMILFENLNQSKKELDMFVIIKDSIEKKLCPYLISTPNVFVHQELSEELNLIGEDNLVQEAFSAAYQVHKGEFIPNPENFLNNVTPVLRSYYSVVSPNVSDFIIGLSIDQSHWRALNIETSPDNGENWICDTSMFDLTWVRTVNGKEVGRTTKKYGEIYKKIQNVLPTSRREKR
ncbi:hypothetical protein COL99_24445 [Bacillus toyonensis]|uniref:hypothetical protein n=2 Tax=Bacillus toyonensis TaxID=155322 RepID=UPI000BFA2402|nr:hypothetical protein [Bacillus toyonensis]PGC09942.1 hypothetical protein COL99_24445 [Bacillus toyonensis]PGC78810.1 hypothetical protein COM28_19325 [Bacillus toyonensis]